MTHSTPLNQAVSEILVEGPGVPFGATRYFIDCTMGRQLGGIHEGGVIGRLRGRIAALRLFLVAMQSLDGSNKSAANKSRRAYTVYHRANLVAMVRQHCFGMLNEASAAETKQMFVDLAADNPPKTAESTDYSLIPTDDFSEPSFSRSILGAVIQDGWNQLGQDSNIPSSVFIGHMHACLATMHAVYNRAIELGGRDVVAANLDLCAQLVPVDGDQKKAAHELLSFVNAAQSMGMGEWMFGHTLSNCEIGEWEELFGEWEIQANLAPGSMGAVAATGGWLDRLGVITPRTDPGSWFNGHQGPLEVDNALVFAEAHADAKSMMLKILKGALEDIATTCPGLDAFSHLGVDHANLRSFARSNTPLRVLLVGDSGTGKSAVGLSCAQETGRPAVGVVGGHGAMALVRNLSILQSQATMLGRPFLLIDPLDAHLNSEHKSVILQHLLSSHARGQMNTSEVWTLQGLKDIPASLLSGFDLVVHLRAMPLAQRERLAAQHFPEPLAKRVAQMSSCAGDVLAAAQWSQVSGSMQWNEIAARMHGIQEAGLLTRETNDDLPLQVYNIEGRREGFECVAGQEDAVARARKLIACLRDPQRFKALNATSPKGVLLVGGPGMGKTHLARAMAVEAGVPFLSADCAAMARNANTIGAVFAEARKLSPCILFLDELDAIGTEAKGVLGASPDPQRQGILNRLLMELDGMETLDGVLVIGATHRGELLDKALVRSGRLGWRITLARPDTKSRRTIWAHYAARSQCADTIDWDRIARISSGMTPADVAQAFNAAAIDAVEAGVDRIGSKHLVDAIDEVLWKGSAAEVYLLEEEIWRTSVHEAGHALMAWCSGTEIERVSVRPRSSVLGYVRMLGQDGKISKSREDMMAEIATSFGGLCAEEVALGHASNGAGSDLEKIRATIAHCIREEGMHARFPAGVSESVSMQMLRQVERVEEEILTGLRASTRQWLDEHRQALEAFATLLMQQREMDGPEVEAALSTLLPDSRGKRRSIESLAAYQWGATV